MGLEATSNNGITSFPLNLRHAILSLKFIPERQNQNLCRLEFEPPRKNGGKQYIQPPTVTLLISL